MPSGFDIQKRFDNLVADLSATALFEQKKKSVDIALRSVDNGLQILTVNANSDGTLDAGTAAAVQAIVDPLKTNQDSFNAAKFSYDMQNVSENVAALSSAYGEYRNS